MTLCKSDGELGVSRKEMARKWQINKPVKRDTNSNASEQNLPDIFRQVGIFHLTNSNAPLLLNIILYLNSHASSS
jgi:hypothetical protein